MRINAAIFGCAGTELTDAEQAFFQEVQPWGFILFARNVEDPEQLRRLVGELKSCVSRDSVPILIDQEGGRVRRLRPPHWPDYVAGNTFGQLHSIDPEKGCRLAWLQSRLMAIDLSALGINVDCLPVLDVPAAGSHEVIGDRAYSSDPGVVAEIGRAAAEGLLAGGVLPVIKHIPGHGRGSSDSHHELPVVDTPPGELAACDFVPFARLADLPLAMTGHLVFSEIDAENCATHSRTVVNAVIRGEIGFDGLLMTDDLSMHALSGDFSARTDKAFAAGCDCVLHCNGDMTEMTAVGEALRPLEGKALQRAEKATALLARAPEPADEAALRQEYSALLDEVKHMTGATV